jgi:CheY-like chemotaxis protein
MIVHREEFAEAIRVHPRHSSLQPPQPLERLSGITVLAVDDEPDALRLIREVLEAAGARVVSAPSAEAALDTLMRERPDVVLSDIAMPGVDGWEFIARLRRSQDGLTRAVPAAALTALARSEDRIRVLTSGYQMHLAKPVNPAELVAAVRALASRADIAESS